MPSISMTQTRTVTHKRLVNSLKYCIKAKRPAFIVGPPGVGKSDVVSQLCASSGGKLYDLRMSQIEQTDLRGIPYYNRDTGMMDWAQPVDLPTKEDAAKYPVVFLFLDEMNSASPSVQAAAYQLILNRRVGKYELPDNCVVIAAGNREQDKGVTYRMPAPLANRFVHFELAVDFDSWNEWAVENRINKNVVGYLNSSKNSLYQFDTKSADKSFPTPRSWEFVSQLIDEECDDQTAIDIIAGTIGEGEALKFLAYCKNADKLPKASDILSGKIKELESKEISIMYSLSTSLNYELKDMWEKVGKTKNEDSFHAATDNMLEFIMDNFGKEMVVVTLRTLLQQFKLTLSPNKLKNFSRFQKDFAKLLISASSV